ncbi:unnamed protein product, partial [Brachionus calyciflorus]
KKDYFDLCVTLSKNHTHNKSEERPPRENPPSESFLRKIHSEYNQNASVNVTNKFQIENDNDVSSVQNENDKQADEFNAKKIVEVEAKPKYSFDFISNIITVSESLRDRIRGNKLDGYVQETSTYPSIKIHLFLEKQFESINKTPVNNRILQFDATGSLVSIPIEKSWLCSCVAHTMKRFSRSLKPLIKNFAYHKFICYLFSLLVNSINLEQITNNFKFISIILLSKYQDQKFKHALNNINSALLNRDSELSEEYFKDLINKCSRTNCDPTKGDMTIDIFNQIKSNFSNAEPTNEEEDLEDESKFQQDLSDHNNKRNETIKTSSPFYAHFKNVESDVIRNLASDACDDDSNFYQNSAIFEHLLENFMPYCFIWAGLLFQI